MWGKVRYGIKMYQCDFFIKSQATVRSVIFFFQSLIHLIVSFSEVHLPYSHCRDSVCVCV
jgi:hypothetical protein